MKKVDRTKENIKVDELDDKTRKQMFDKFVQSGGKVVNEHDSQQIKLKKRVPTVTTSTKRTYPAKNTVKESKQPQIKHEVVFETWLQKKLSHLFIRLRLLFLGVTGFSADTFKHRFCYNVIHDYKTALLQFQVQYFYLFNPQYSKQIIAKLDAVNPLYYELIVMISNIFDRTRFTEIEEIIQQNEPVSTSKLKNHIIPIYRSLYILYPYIELIELAYRTAYDTLGTIEKQKSSVYYERKKFIRNSLYTTFYKLLPRLHIIICYYYNVYIDITNPYVQTIMQITQDDLPGKRKAIQSNQEASQQQEAETQEQTTQTPPHIIKGISLMNISTNDIMTLFKNNSSVQPNPADKAAITYVLFKKFDDEFSIVLTTNKIKYNIQFTESGKIDYKNRLADLYNELRKITESFQEYMHILETYERIRSEKPMSNAQYIEYTRILTQLEKKKKVQSKNMRMVTKSIMDAITAELDILIKDMDEEHKIVDNPQDFLEFDLNVESAHLLQDKKVYEAIHLAYFYACALSFRLQEGDLAGDVEFKEGETPLAMVQQNEKSSSASETGNTSTKKESSSVIQELDDLF